MWLYLNGFDVIEYIAAVKRHSDDGTPGERWLNFIIAKPNEYFQLYRLADYFEIDKKSDFYIYILLGIYTLLGYDYKQEVKNEADKETRNKIYPGQAWRWPVFKIQDNTDLINQSISDNKDTAIKMLRQVFPNDWKYRYNRKIIPNGNVYLRILARPDIFKSILDEYLPVYINAQIDGFVKKSTIDSDPKSDFARIGPFTHPKWGGWRHDYIADWFTVDVKENGIFAQRADEWTLRANAGV